MLSLLAVLGGRSFMSIPCYDKSIAHYVYSELKNINIVTFLRNQTVKNTKYIETFLYIFFHEGEGE